LIKRVVVAVVGLKGGAGKSTLSANLAGVFAESGHSVTLLDMDPQASIGGLVRGSDRISVLGYGAQAELHAQQGDITEWLAAQLPADGLAILDTPPTLSRIARAAISVATRVIAPTRLGQQDLDALLSTMEMAPGALIIINGMTRARLHRDSVAALRAHFGRAVASQEIAQSITIEEAMAAGLPVVAYRKKSALAGAFRALGGEILHG